MTLFLLDEAKSVNSYVESEYESVDIDKTLSVSSDEEKITEKTFSSPVQPNLQNSPINSTKEAEFQDSFSTTLYNRSHISAATKRTNFSSKLLYY